MLIAVLAVVLVVGFVAHTWYIRRFRRLYPNAPKTNGWQRIQNLLSGKRMCGKSVALQQASPYS